MFVVWHFVNDLPQLQGIFDLEEDAKKACEIWDCYHEMEKNKIYPENINTTELALYKVPSGSFKLAKDICHD